jgi:hypothetical protein
MFISNYLADRIERENYSITTSSPSSIASTSSPSLFPSTYTITSSSAPYTMGVMYLVSSYGNSAVYKYEYYNGEWGYENCPYQSNDIVVGDGQSMKDNQPLTTSQLPGSFSSNGNTATLNNTNSFTSTIIATCAANSNALTNPIAAVNMTITTIYAWYTI